MSVRFVVHYACIGLDAGYRAAAVVLSASDPVWLSSRCDRSVVDAHLFRVERLDLDDVDRAREMFALMATVFDETNEELLDADIAALLHRPDFWATPLCATTP